MAILTSEYIPASLDLYLEQGDDFFQEMTLKDFGGDILNLTGFVPEVSLKKYYNTQFDYGMSVAVLDATNGRIRLTMDELLTEKLDASRYVYTVKMKNGTESVVVLKGQVMVSNQP